MNALLLYLLEASVYLIGFALAYKLLFARLTHFQWMRVYLLLSLLLSLGLPLLPSPELWFDGSIAAESVGQSLSFVSFASPDWLPAWESVSSSARKSSSSSWGLIIPMILLVYGVGVLYKLSVFGYNLWKIQRLISRHPRQREGKQWIVFLPQEGPAFSFWRCVFLGRMNNLTPEEQQQVKAHERVHVRQRHTLDLLFFEVGSILLWFHPLVYYLKKQLQEVQEYLADQAVSGQGETRKHYTRLLLKLATENRAHVLGMAFSGKQVGRRILMLSNPRSLPRERWVFALVIPILAGLFLLSACLEETSPNEIMIDQSVSNRPVDLEGSRRIGRIEWRGNTVYDDKTLTDVLGILPGDPYDSVAIEQGLNFNPDEPDVSSLYMDRGYLFFTVNVQKKSSEEGVVDLVMDMYEGDMMRLGEIIIRGNQDVPMEEILRQIPLKSGEVFNRRELIEAQKAIASMGYFDPEKVGVNPIPYPELGEVSIEFVVKRLTTP